MHYLKHKVLQRDLLCENENTVIQGINLPKSEMTMTLAIDF